MITFTLTIGLNFTKTRFNKGGVDNQKEKTKTKVVQFQLVSYYSAHRTHRQTLCHIKLKQTHPVFRSLQINKRPIDVLSGPSHKLNQKILIIKLKENNYYDKQECLMLFNNFNHLQ